MVNLQEQFNGGQNVDRNNLFFNHYPHNHHSKYFTSLVKSDWKIIYHFQIKGQPSYELFHLKDDPFETNNLAKKNPEQLKIMMKILSDEMKNKNALYPVKDGQLLGLIMPK